MRLEQVSFRRGYERLPRRRVQVERRAVRLLHRPIHDRTRHAIDDRQFRLEAIAQNIALHADERGWGYTAKLSAAEVCAAHGTEA